MAIDYWLGSEATTPVTLEILDSGGRVLQTYSSAAAVAAAGAGAQRGGRAGGIPSVSPQWLPSPSRFEAGPGAHRVVWFQAQPAAPGERGGDGPFGAPRIPLTGTFTARLTANGRSMTRTFTVLPDPRKSD